MTLNTSYLLTMRSFLFIAVSFFTLQDLLAQYIFSEANPPISVQVNGNQLNDPFTGGFNAPQICSIDLNLDGVQDLVLHDRSGGPVRPYINRGIKDSASFYYAPEYAAVFPEIRDWVLTADYNNDGKMDLFEGSSSIVVWENISTAETGLKFELKEKLTSRYTPGSSVSITINPGSGVNLPAIYDIDGDSDLDLLVNSSNGKTIDYHRNFSIENNGNFEFDFERRNTCWGNVSEGIGKRQDTVIIGSDTLPFFPDSIYLDSCPGGIPINGELIGNNSTIINTVKNQENTKGIKHAGGVLTAFDIDRNGSADLAVTDIESNMISIYLNEDSIAPFIDSRIFKILSDYPPNNPEQKILFPAVFFMDVNNDGMEDMLVSPNSVTKFTSTSLSLDRILYYENVDTSNGNRFQLRDNHFLAQQTLDFGIGCHPIFIDYNKDGLMDLLIGNDGHIDADRNKIIGQLYLFENIGTSSNPAFSLIDSNYLNLPELPLFRGQRKETRNIMPSHGDIDGDGDEDLLISEDGGFTYLFEDTSQTGMPAAFKFHPENYQKVNIRGNRSIAPYLFDTNGDGLLDLLISHSGFQINRLLNFGTRSQPIFNIPLDSIVWLGGKNLRYVFGDSINTALIKVGDSMAVNGAGNLANNPFIPLIVTKIDSNSRYIECRSTLFGTLDSTLNESNSGARMNFYNLEWGNLQKSDLNIRSPRLSAYRENGNIQLIVGSTSGNTYLFGDIPDTAKPTDQFRMYSNNYIENNGFFGFTDLADINNDGILDIVIGNEGGGLKLLYGASFTSSFQVTPTSLTIGQAAGSTVEFNVLSDREYWTVSENANWLNANIQEGAFNQRVQLTASRDNNSNRLRTTIVSISAPPLAPIDVTVIQDTSSFKFNVNPSSLMLGAKNNSTAEFFIDSDLNSWSISENASWLSLDTLLGSFSDTIVATALEDNSSNTQRSTEITISSPPRVPRIISITQDTFRITGISELQLNEEIQLYPNPNSGNFIFKNKSNQRQLFTLIISSLNGQILKNEEIDIQGEYFYNSNLPNGVYLLQLTSKNQHLRRKLIIQK